MASLRNLGALAAFGLLAAAALGQPCTVPDNGGGTVDLPPSGCGYVSPDDLHVMIDGLPPGTQINVAAEHAKFFNVSHQPGGSLGGEIEMFNSVLFMEMTGTGALGGYHRFMTLVVQCEVHTGPRVPGDPVQSFPNTMWRLEGQTGGDPEFDLLRIRAGDVFGMPSPGHTTLTMLPGGNWSVDSFFDIFYEIEFIGAPGGPLGGMGGSTTGTIRMATDPAARTEERLMVVDSNSDKVMTFNSFDGSLIDPAFIDLVPAGASTPINAVRAGNEIWVTDQLTDRIMRFTLDGTTHLGNITGAIDNIRGLEVVGDTAYVSNAGTANGAPGEAVVTVDIPTATITGFWRVGDDSSGDPFDVLDLGDGTLLVNDIDSQDLEVHKLDGTWSYTFHNSDGSSGIDFPEQMHRTRAGTVLAAGFSSPAGVYEYNALGGQINYWAVTTGGRGVRELGNGTIMYTDGGGVFVFDPVSGSDVLIQAAGGRFIDGLVVDQTPPCNPCDTNCDGSVNGQDITNFIAALSGTPSTCSPCNSDADGNGTVNGQDIDDFIACLTP